MFLLLWFAVVILGLTLGSFTTCLIYRLPRRLSIWRVRQARLPGYDGSRSFCPSCGHVLAWSDLIPVFSWIFQRGKCRYCGHEIGLIYPIVELVVLLGVLSFFLIFGFTVQALALSFLLPALAGFIAFLTRNTRS